MRSFIFRGYAVFIVALCLFAVGCSSNSPSSVSTATPAPAVSLTPATLTFSSQATGTSSAAQALTLKNTGNAALEVTSIRATGDFAETNTCGSSVAAGDQCAISVSFAPTTTGARSGSVSVTDNASGSPHTSSLSGTGTARLVPTVSLTPSTLTFVSQTTNTTSAAKKLTLRNTGTAALTITSVVAAGNFAQTNNCSSSLAAGSHCTIAVTFTPTKTGTRSGSVTVTDDASGSPHSSSLSGIGAVSACTETGKSTFPSCFALSSPTAATAKTGSPAIRAKTALRKAGQRAIAAASGSGFQSDFGADTAQIAALLDGTDPNPVATIGTLGMSGFTAVLVAQPGGFCFDPGLFYANDPEAAAGGFPASGQMPGAGGLWTPTDTIDSAGQACAAAELNAVLNTSSSFTQVGLAIAAAMNYLAGTNMPSTAGGSYDETAALNAGVQSAGSAAGPFTGVQLATIQFDGTNYIYTVNYTASDFQTNYTGTILLTQTPGASQYIYSGVLQFGIDDTVSANSANPPHLAAGTARYQRTSQTNLNISARATNYPSGSVPTYDSNGELDPTDPNWIWSFSRFGATFDPTSTYLTGNYVYAFQGNAPGVTGAANGNAWVFQVMLAGDGTGSAYYGMGNDNTTIAQDTVWQIDHYTCLHMGTLNQEHLYAQFQPFVFDASTDATAGLYIPSSTVAAQIRYAPTSNCQWTDAQWDGGTAADSFWYDRTLVDANVTPGTPVSPPSPVPQFVVADPNDTTYPFSLFGDGSTAVQTLISAQGFTVPTLY